MNIFLIPAQCFTEFYIVIILKIELLVTKDVLVQQRLLGKWESVHFIAW